MRGYSRPRLSTPRSVPIVAMSLLSFDLPGHGAG